jgi:hypothetical protein
VFVNALGPPMPLGTSDPIKNFQQPLTGLHAHQFKQDGHPQKATLLAPFFSHVEELRQGV